MQVINNVGLSELEVERYLGVLNTKYKGRDISKVTFSIAEENGIEYVDCKLEYYNTPFERIRRITGYLSNVHRFNDGKRAELKDRITHGNRTVPLED